MKGTLLFDEELKRIKMYHNLLKEPSFHALLVLIDDELAEQNRKKACPVCGGVLHQANYPRSPLGLPVFCREQYDSRRSFCCGDCRKRVTTPSVRFFGRRRFPAAIMLLVSVFMSSTSRRRYHQVKQYFGISISLRTWVRWLRWWQECFIGTAFWKQAKAQLPGKALIGRFPHQLLLIYPGRLNNQLEMALQFLSPMTAGINRAV
jgi:hypothetical protein